MAETAFDAATRLEPLGAGRFAGAFADRSWWVARGPHGGLVASLMLAAASAVDPAPERRPRSLTVRYLAAPVEGPFEIVAWVERDGRSLRHLSARLEQGGQTLVLAWATYAAPLGSWEQMDAAAPDVAPADALSSPPDFPRAAPSFAAHLDYRFAIGAPPLAGAGAAHTGGWLRLRDPQPIDYRVAAFLADAWPPALFPLLEAPMLVPTVELSVLFRAELPPAGATDDDFYLAEFSSQGVSEGFWEEDGRIWDARGRLLVQSRQLAVALA